MKASGILITLLLIISMLNPLGAAEKGHRKILGVWEFSAPLAQQPYDRGFLTITEVDKKLKGEFTIQQETLAIPQIDFRSDTLRLGFEIDNTPITVKLKLTNGVLEGFSTTPDGPVTVTARPAKKGAEK